MGEPRSLGLIATRIYEWRKREKEAAIKPPAETNTTDPRRGLSRSQPCFRSDNDLFGRRVRRKRAAELG